MTPSTLLMDFYPSELRWSGNTARGGLRLRKWRVEHLGSPRYIADLNLMPLDSEPERFRLRRGSEDLDSIVFASEEHQYFYECALSVVVEPLRAEFPDVIFEVPSRDASQGTLDRWLQEARAAGDTSLVESLLNPEKQS